MSLLPTDDTEDFDLLTAWGHFGKKLLKEINSATFAPEGKHLQQTGNSTKLASWVFGVVICNVLGGSDARAIVYPLAQISIKEPKFQKKVSCYHLLRSLPL